MKEGSAQMMSGSCRSHSKSGRSNPEQGAAAAFVVLMAIALLAAAGLVIDGGYALAAKRQAMNQAEQAARAGADVLSQAGLRSGQTLVDSTRAVAAAQGYLSSVGASGTVTIDGGEVTVTVTSQQDTQILTVVGVGSIPVQATASATSIDEDD
jgi:Flp pilus assembly protein TadG